MDVASVLSATAATAAAILAGLNLVVAGRREDRRWARETATEAFVAYMDASFKAGAACREAVALRGTPRNDELDELRRRIAVAHDTQMHHLTRLRLLSTAEVVAAAIQLHEGGHKVEDLSFGDAADDGKLEAAREQLRVARSRMVTASREAIRLPDPTGTSQPELWH
jgi:hypothetical protein